MNTERHFIGFTSADVGATTVAGNAWVTLDFGPVSSNLAAADRRKKVRFTRYKTQRAAGASGTAHTALLADVTGSASTAYATKFVGTATAAATGIDETATDKVIYTDTTGKLFFTTGGDAADTFDYEVWFEVLS